MITLGKISVQLPTYIFMRTLFVLKKQYISSVNGWPLGADRFVFRVYAVFD